MGSAGSACAGPKYWSGRRHGSPCTRFKNDLICGFCPLAMPSAASQLISLDLFSSGQRNGFDLASPCNGFFCFVGRFWIAWPFALVVLEFLRVFRFNKTGSILSIDFSFPLKLMLCSFQPANQSECGQIILLWEAHLQQGCREKAWKISKTRGHFQKSSAFLDLCSSSEAYSLFTFSVMFDAMPGIFDGGHLSSSGGLSFADFFRSIYLPASDGHFADDTNQYRLVDGSKPTRQDQSTQNLLKCPGRTAHCQWISLGLIFPIKLHSPAVQHRLNNHQHFALLRGSLETRPQYVGRAQAHDLR